MKDNLQSAILSNNEVSIEVPAEMLDNRASGVTVATINVNRPDGKTARFWVSVAVNASGKTVLKTTALRSNSETIKTTTASFLDLAARRAARGLTPIA
jgi:hypothetical protein